jgi:hypothetical protein
MQHHQAVDCHQLQQAHDVWQQGLPADTNGGTGEAAASAARSNRTTLIQQIVRNRPAQ